MLKYGEQYVDNGMNYYEEKYRDHEIRSMSHLQLKVASGG
jgi:hypothetical protein